VFADLVAFFRKDGGADNQGPEGPSAASRIPPLKGASPEKGPSTPRAAGSAAEAVRATRHSNDHQM
jgi:hypothetical protein